MTCDECVIVLHTNTNNLALAARCKLFFVVANCTNIPVYKSFVSLYGLAHFANLNSKPERPCARRWQCYRWRVCFWEPHDVGGW